MNNLKNCKTWKQLFEYICGRKLTKWSNDIPDEIGDIISYDDEDEIVSPENLEKLFNDNTQINIKEYFTAYGNVIKIYYKGKEYETQDIDY